jgi:hypothetical protein
MSPRTSTCSQGSAASPSPRKPRASKPSRSAKKTADAASSSSEPGACPSTTTLTPSTVGNTEELPLFLEGLHASPPVVPGSKAARATTAGSGRRLFAFCSSQRRTHLFTRTLLGSSTWRSTENLLRWEVTGLPSEITEIFSLVQDPASSSKSWAKSKRVVTRSSRSLFLLVPSTARNSGCESGLSDSEAIEGDESLVPWPTPTTDADRNRTKKYAQGGTPLNMLVNQTSWPTPNARDTKSEEVSPEYAEERNAETRGQTLSWVAARTWPAPTATDQTRAGSPETDEDKKARGAKVGTSLTDAVAKANWPTPNTGDSERSGKRPSRGSRTGGYISEVTPATWPTPQVHQGPNNSENRGSAHGGNRRRLTPQNPKDLMANWPTPRNNTGEDVKRPQREKGGHHLTVGGAIRSWPTPNASDGSGGASDPSTRKGEGGSMKHSTQLPDYVGSPTSGPFARMTKFVERLSNLSAWIMGYTAQYLRHWETRSSRNSCSDSSSLSET